jgi:hypothetical protein
MAETASGDRRAVTTSADSLDQAMALHKKEEPELDAGAGCKSSFEGKELYDANERTLLAELGTPSENGAEQPIPSCFVPPTTGVQACGCWVADQASSGNGRDRSIR